MAITTMGKVKIQYDRHIELVFFNTFKTQR